MSIFLVDIFALNLFKVYLFLLSLLSFLAFPFPTNVMGKWQPQELRKNLVNEWEWEWKSIFFKLYS